MLSVEVFCVLMGKRTSDWSESKINMKKSKNPKMSKGLLAHPRSH